MNLGKPGLREGIEKQAVLFVVNVTEQKYLN